MAIGGRPRTGISFWEWPLQIQKRRRLHNFGKVVNDLRESCTSVGCFDGFLPRWSHFEKDRAIRKHNVVGLQDEENTMVGYLMEKIEELDVISIIGMRGLGKTTLARKIFQNQEISSEFPTRIWINVSEKFKLRNVHLDILKTFTSQDMSNLSDRELTETMRACLATEKFFLILDDVWSTDHWIDIQNTLPKSNGMGKVIITSRREDVGVLASVNREPYKMRLLTTEESWKLLQLEVFGNLEDCPSEMEGIRLQFMRNCDGLPLHIKVVGGILAGQLHAPGSIQMEWLKVSEKFLHNKKGISDVVELSYNALPYYLKECFLYMGVFPNNYEIPAWTLTRLWIAEGFIHNDSDHTLEETATQILYELIMRNLVMVDKINPIGEVKTCCIHDMIHEFCIWKAKEQNLYKKIKRSPKGVLEPPVSELLTVRRLCVHSNVKTLLTEVPNIPRVRSFFCFYNSPEDCDQSYIPSILDKLILLRVFVAESIKFHEIPLVITKLLHLKYITLSAYDLDILPKSLSKLWNLQTLVVETKSGYVTMEANLWRMSLRHFKTNATIVLLTKGTKGTVAGAGANLQTLNRLSPQSCTTDVSKMARNLITLGVRGKIATLLGNRFLENLGRLQKLKLENDSFIFEKASEIPVRDLPQPNCFPPNLKRLTLSNTFLKWKHMSTLAHINTLEVLKLKDNAVTGIYWNALGDRFGSLQFLLIANTDLVHWEASADSFPYLKCLVLMNCVNLNEIPVALAETLEKLDIEHLGKSAVHSAMKIAELKKQTQEPKNDKSCSGLELSIGPGCFW